MIWKNAGTSLTKLERPIDTPYQAPKTELLVSKQSVSIPYFFIGLHVLLFILAVFYFGFVVPEFVKMFEEFGLQLPVLTKFGVAIAGLGKVGVFLIFGMIQTVVIGIAIGLANFASGKRFSTAWKVFSTVIWVLFIGFAIMSMFAPTAAISSGLAA